MKYFSMVFKAVLISIFLCAATGFADDQKPDKPNGKAAAAAAPRLSEERVTLNVPVFSPLFSDTPVASVSGEPITLKELTEMLARSHEEMSEKKEKAGKKDYCDILKRMINTRLILAETRNMGFDELPEYKKAVSLHSKTLLREMLREQHIKDVKVNKSEVEKKYKDAIKQYKIASIFFGKEEPAKKMEKEIKAGKDFAKVAKEAIEKKEASGELEGKFIKNKDLQPEVEKVVSSMKTGSVSPVIKVESGYTILKLEDISYPDDPKVKEQTEQEVLELDKTNAFKKYLTGLIKKYVMVDKKVFNSLDYEAKKPGFGKFMKDKRVLIRVKGEKPVTVAEFSEVLKGKFFHGIEESIKDKQVNAQKFPTMEEVVQKRVLEGEAVRQGIDKTKEYKDRLRDYENSLLFGLFITKVISPEVKVKDDEVKAYYEKHKSDYTSLKKVKLSSLVFTKRKAADDAIDKLEKGADFQWVRDNAEGQVKKTDGLMVFDGASMFTAELPQGARKAIEDAKSGDFKLYESPDGYYYVIYVQEIAPPVAQPLDSVKGMINKKILNEKMTKDLDDWAGKLTTHYKVEVYLSNCEQL